MEEIKKRAEIVNEEIKKFLPIKDPEKLYKAARHLINAGGKRLRPVLSLIACEAIERDYRKILPAAVAIEVIHNFTLIHDDIMDEDEFRRGVKTVHTIYGVPTAILAGDTLFAEAFKIMSYCKVKSENLVDGMRKLAEVCVEICEGQQMDIEFEERDFVSEEEYLEMVRKKTSVLIALSSSIPAILFGEKKYESALWNFGINAGIAFQIKDDILDLLGKDKIGKDWGSDLVEGKKTLIVIKAFEEGVELESFGKGKAEIEAIEKDVKKLMECGAIEYAENKAIEYLNKAKKELEVLKDNEGRRLLEALAEFFVKREY